MKILVVEDEAKTAALIEKGLRETGYDVVVAKDGGTGLERALATSYGLLILDVMLPKRDGWSVVSELRSRNVNTPILFLTARDSVEERVKGLSLGADDYLAKPFVFAELLARVRAVVRRFPVHNQQVFEVADLQIDTIRQKATRSGLILQLTPMEFRVLVELARADGEVVPRGVLVKEVWDVKLENSSNVVDVMVRRLRTRVDDPFEKKLIQTVRGVGYALHPNSAATPETTAVA